MTSFQINISILVLIFSVGDIIGNDRLEKVEKSWLESARSYFRVWKRFLKDNYDFFPDLVNVTLLFLHALAQIILLLTLLVTPMVFLVLSSRLGLSNYYTILAVCFILILIIIWVKLNTKSNQISDRHIARMKIPFSGQFGKVPLELSIISFAFIRMRSYDMIHEEAQSKALKNPWAAKELFSGAVLVVTFRSIRIVATLITILVFSLTGRMLLLISTLLIWLFLLLPSILLYRIAKWTGAPSYFSVAKYILGIVLLLIEYFKN